MKILLLDNDKTLQTVLTRYLERRGYKEIGQRLFISCRTVQTHLSNIIKKLNLEHGLNLENRSQLVRFAFEHGYRPPQTQDEQRAVEARG